MASNVEWLRAEKVDNETLRVSYDENTSTESREGIVTASIGEVSGTITVMQSGAPAETEPEDPDTTDEDDDGDDTDQEPADPTAETRKEIEDAIETLKSSQDTHIQPTTAVEEKVNALKSGTPTPEDIQGAKDAIKLLKVPQETITNLQSKIDEISAKITTLENAGNAPAGTIQPLKEGLEARKRTQTQITTMQEKLTALESEIAGVEEKIAIEDLMAALKTKQDPHIQTQAFDEAEAKVNALKSGTPTPEDIQGAKDAITLLKMPQETITTLQAQIDEISAKITALEAAGNAPAGTIQPLKDGLEARKRTQTQITTMQGKLTALESEIAGVEEKIVIEDLSTLAGKQDSQLQTIANARMKLATLKAMINSANFVAARQAIEVITVPSDATVMALQGEIDAISAKITALKNAGNAPSGTIQPLKDGLAARETAQMTIAGTAAAVSNLQTELYKITVPAKTTEVQNLLKSIVASNGIGWSRIITEQEIEKVKSLIEEGADVNAQGYGTTILLLLLKQNRPPRSAQTFLAFPGINVNIKDNEGKTALDWANAINRFTNGRQSLLNALEKVGAKTAAQLDAE